MNKHLTNKNLLRGITGLAIAGLAGAALSAGSVAASGTEICVEPGPNGLPQIVDCPPEISLPLPGYTPTLPGINLGGTVDYDALLDYLGNDDAENNDEADDADGGFEIPGVGDFVDPDRFAPLQPNLDLLEPENPFLGTDDDAEPELAQPEAEVAPEPQPEVAPEAQPEVASEAQPEVAPEAQPEVRVNNSEVAPEELPVNPESDMPEAEMPQVEIPEAVTPEIVIPNTDADTDVDGTTDLDDAGLLEAAPVEVFTDATDTDGANIGLYAGILLILAGGGSLAAIAATRRNRD